MFTTEQMERIRKLVEEQVLPEVIAQELNLPYSTFRNHLNLSGYRIKSVRVLEAITPVAPLVEVLETVPA